MSAEIYSFSWPHRWVTVISRKAATVAVFQETASRSGPPRPLTRVYHGVRPSSLARLARLRRRYPPEV
jgi:hypothetical protein